MIRKTRKQVVSFTAEPELLDYLIRMAEADRTSISQYIRNVLWCGYQLEDFRKENIKEINQTKNNLQELINNNLDNYTEDEFIESPEIDNITKF